DLPELTERVPPVDVALCAPARRVPLRTVPRRVRLSALPAIEQLRPALIGVGRDKAERRGAHRGDHRNAARPRSPSWSPGTSPPRALRLRIVFDEQPHFAASSLVLSNSPACSPRAGSAASVRTRSLYAGHAVSSPASILEPSCSSRSRSRRCARE